MAASMLLHLLAFTSTLECIAVQGFSYSWPRSPNATGERKWADANAQASDFVSKLTLEEKVGMVTGVQGPCVGSIPPIQRLGFNGLCLQDGPLAIRQADFASVFPAGLSAAASWDTAMIFQRGVYIGSEFKAKGAHIALGPVGGPLGRHALGGRNWEGFSPDPYLTAVAMGLTIEGMQKSGVQACGKHYIGNEQETQRNPSTPRGSKTTIQAVSSNMDDRTLHELYLWPFAAAVKSGVSSMMCSYNRLNETYACENSKILNGVLKGELGFQGYVMSDWSATHSGVPAVLAGLDMDMPGSIGDSPNASFFGGNLTQAVNNGSVSEIRLDDMVRRIMMPYYHLGQDHYPTVDPSSADLANFDPSTSPYQWDMTGSKHRDVRGSHCQFIRDLGAASIVLLKNTNGTLPLKSPKNIGVFGNDAADESDGLYTLNFPRTIYGYDYGALFVGGGSGTGRLTYIVSPLEAIKARGHQDGALVQYITNNAIVSNTIASIYPAPQVCLVFLKTYVTEGSDRTSYEADWNSTAVVTNVALHCPNTIVITHSGGANLMPWADNANVTAIIAAHLPGQEIGNSVVDVLYGAVNPSGKLPYTIAHDASGYNAPIVNITSTTPVLKQGPNAWQSPFTEGLLIDYRHFDATNITPRYEFGYGLSYTTFSISNLNITRLTDSLNPYPPPESPPSPGGNAALYHTVLKVTCTVANTGSVGGATVPQLYLSFPQDFTPPGTPVQVLRGFDKVMISPGQSTTVSFALTRKDVSFWDVVVQDWKVPSGEMSIGVGLSSRDIKMRGCITLI